MKIAIIISGRISDNLSEYKNYFEQIYENNDIDFFVSYAKTYNRDSIDKFIELYKPKKIKESDEKYFDNISNYYYARIETNRHNTLCMFLNRFYGFCMLEEYVNETGTQYDCVLSLRSELIFKEKFPFLELMFHINNDEICIPMGFDYVGAINDHIAVGNFKNMKIYLSLYQNIPHLLENGCVFHPETLLREHLKDQKMNIHRFPLNYMLEKDKLDIPTKHLFNINFTKQL